MDLYWGESCIDPSFEDNSFEDNEAASAESNINDSVDFDMKIIQDFSTNPEEIENFRILKDVKDEQKLYSLINCVKLQVFFNIMDQYSDEEEICSLDIHILSILLKKSSSKIFDNSFLEFLLSHQKLIIAPLLYYPIQYLSSDKKTLDILIDICIEILGNIDFQEITEIQTDQFKYILLSIYEYIRSTGSFDFEYDIGSICVYIIETDDVTWKPCVGPSYKLYSLICINESIFRIACQIINTNAEKQILDSDAQDSVEGALCYFYIYIQNVENFSSEYELTDVIDMMLEIRPKLDNCSILMDIVEVLASIYEEFYQEEKLLYLLLDSFDEPDLMSENRIYLFRQCLEKSPKDENWLSKQTKIYDLIIMNSDKLEAFEQGKNLVNQIRSEYKTRIRP